jgi:alpha-glucoside transport system permease protein
MTVTNHPKRVASRGVRGNKFRQFFNQSLVRIILIVVVFIWTLPTVGLLISSFRAPDAIRTTGWWTALQTPFEITQWTLENYNYVLTSDRMGAAFLNSLLVSIPATIIPITVAAFAAYAFAWMKFPGRDLLFSIVVGLMVVPLQMAFIPVLRVYRTLGLNGSFLGIWLAHTGFGLPLAVFLLHSYIAGLPSELIEAASIDGASHFTTFTRLVLPLAVPSIASFAIFQFLWVWNDLLVALVFLGTGPEVTVVTSRLSEMVGSRGQDWHVLTAGAFISMLLPIIVFFALQRYFVRGLLAGSVKG